MNTSIGDARLRFRQEEAAMHQLARAITLFLAERDYICAITLAGAADGILGEILKSRDANPAIEAHATLAVDEGQMQDKKRARDNFNFARNVLKHKRLHEQAEVAMAVETESIYLISRAIDNAVRLGHELRPPLPAFIDWIYKNRTDLIGDDDA